MSGRCVCGQVESRGQNYTPNGLKSNSGCPVSMCRDRRRGGEQEMDDVRKRENVWFIVFTS